MGIKKQVDIMECDICKYIEVGAIASPFWVSLEVQINSVQRETITKTICWNCSQEIKEALE